MTLQITRCTNNDCPIQRQCARVVLPLPPPHRWRRFAFVIQRDGKANCTDYLHAKNYEDKT